jgi:hypothetical protein
MAISMGQRLDAKWEEILMVHFMALVLLTPDTSNIQEMVRNLLNPFYSELEVEPYREYLNPATIEEEIRQLSVLSQEELESLALDWEVPSKNLEEIAKLRLDWFEDDVIGTDERGPYRFSTINPCGKWDSYTFLESEMAESGEIIRYPCRVADLPEVIPYAVITPDGLWHEIGKDIGVQTFAKTYLNHNVPISEEEKRWNSEVQEMLIQYSDHIAIGLNCHL